MTRAQARHQVVTVLEDLLPRLRAGDPAAWAREVDAASPWDNGPRVLEQAIAYMLLGMFLERWSITVDEQGRALLVRLAHMTTTISGGSAALRHGTVSCDLSLSRPRLQVARALGRTAPQHSGRTLVRGRRGAGGVSA